MRQVLNVFAVLFGLFFAGIGIVVGWVHSTDTTERSQFETTLRDQLTRDFNTALNREREDREKFEASMQAKLLGLAEGAKLLLLYKEPSGNLVNLDQTEIEVASIQDSKDKTWGLRFYIVAKNVGDETITSPVLKWYGNDPSLLSDGVPSSDEPRYRYEETLEIGGQGGKFMPGQFATTIEITEGSFKSDKFVLSREPLLMKVYYGKGNIATGTVFLTRHLTHQ